MTLHHPRSCTPPCFQPPVSLALCCLCTKAGVCCCCSCLKFRVKEQREEGPVLAFNSFLLFTALPPGGEHVTPQQQTASEAQIYDNK